MTLVAQAMCSLLFSAALWGVGGVLKLDFSGSLGNTISLLVYTNPMLRFGFSSKETKTQDYNPKMSNAPTAVAP